MRSLEICTQRIFNNLIKQNQNWILILFWNSQQQCPGSRPLRPKCSIKHPDSGIQSLGSRVQCLESTIQYPESRVPLPESSIQSPAFRVQSPASRVQSPASRVKHWVFSIHSPASSVQRPESSVQSPVSRVQLPESSVQGPTFRVQRPTIASSVQEFWYALFLLMLHIFFCWIYFTNFKSKPYPLNFTINYSWCDQSKATERIW